MKKPLNAYGLWEVTTEGDVEGRSILHLGVYEGYIDDIAFALANQTCYSLRFKAGKPLPKEETSPKVNVSLEIDSGTWDMGDAERIRYFKNMLHGRDVTIEAGTSYASVTLFRGSSPEARKKAQDKIDREKALSKLSDSDKRILGLLT